MQTNEFILAQVICDTRITLVMSVKDNLEIKFSKVFFIKNISMLGLASKCQLSSSKSSFMCFDMEKSNLIDVFYLFIFFSL